jgi:hypothetical protein
MSLSVFQRILTGKNRQRAEARRKRLVSAFQKRKGFSLDILEPRMLLSADALPAAVVTTDQLDYAPGETAIISAFNNGTEGVEFVAGEEVRFEVTRTDGVGDSPLGNLPWIVTDGVGGFEGYYVDANTDGTLDYGVFPDTDLTVNARFGTTWFVEQQYLGGTLRLTATGLDSGAVATTDFTDSALDISSGTLNYSVGGNNNNNVTVSVSGGIYTINDTGETITLTAAAIAAGWTGSGTNTVSGPDSSVSSLIINVGNGDDVVTIRSINDPTTVNGGNASDTINIGNASNSLDQILAAVTFDGGNQDDHVVINDQGDATNNNYTLTGTSLVRAGGPTLNYTDVVDVTLNAGTGADAINLTPASGVTFSINGGVPAVAPGDSLTLDLTGVTSPTLSLTNSGPAYDGSWTFGNRNPVNFTSIETLADAPSFSVNNATAAETNSGTTTFTFTVTLSNGFAGDTYSVQYATANATATTGDGDYTGITLTTLSGFSTTAPTKTFTVTVAGDNKVEANETFLVNLSNALRTSGSGAAPLITVPTGTGTITNDDTATYQISDATITEGGNLVFTVSLSNPVDIATTLDISFTDVSTASSDFTHTTQQVTFAALDTANKSVTVATTADTLVEATETLTASLALTAALAGGRLSNTTDTGTGTITDNDTATFTINDVTVNEAAGTLTFTVSLSTPIDTMAKVNVSYGGGTAAGGGTDYDSASDPVTFAANSTTAQTVTVAITDDNIVEATESFLASLALDATTPLTGYSTTLSDTGTGTISDNDTATFTINDVTVNEAAGTLTFTVSLSTPIDTDGRESTSAMAAVRPPAAEPITTPRPTR